MLGVAAQRIVRTIRKPRNDADEAIAPKPEWDGAFRAICFVAPLAHGGLPRASRRFVQLIPESRRRGHAGLIQRFLRSNIAVRRDDRQRYPDALVYLALRMRISAHCQAISPGKKMTTSRSRRAVASASAVVASIPSMAPITTNAPS